MDKIKKYFTTNHLTEFLTVTNYVSVRIHHYTKLRTNDKIEYLNRALYLSTYCDGKSFNKLIKCINRLNPLLISKIISKFFIFLLHSAYITKYIDSFSVHIIVNLDINDIMMNACSQGNIDNIELYCSIFRNVPKPLVLTWIDCADKNGHNKIRRLLQSQYISPLRKSIKNSITVK